jgi:hypothetical protein
LFGSVQSVTNSFFAWTATQPLPSSIAFGDVVLLELQARVSAGTGTVSAQQLMFAGVQS